LYLLLEISLIISCLNVLGMIPYSFSVTSQILYPFTLSLTFFLYNNLIGIYSYNFKIFNLFMPGGVPLFITPLLLIIEYISYFARIFSLSIRLCANMLSVHVLLKILIGFAVILLYQSLWGQYLLMLLLSIFLLDISTCFLQAYIFIFLSLVYLSNIIFIH
jgi:F-type H+-transporting ATPase subunit a